jgi:putative serine/threonine protein kinase
LSEWICKTTQSEDSALKREAIVGLKELSKEPYASMLCYPKPTKAEVNKRLRELAKLGIDAFEFVGEKQVSNLNILGKGCVGLVVLAFRGSEKAALKIRRVDADRARMQREAELLERANSVGVGPRLLVASRNCLLMQFIDGVLLPEWLKRCRGKTRIRKVLHELLVQCRRLDETGLDHGELSHAPKHLLVDRADRPFVVDFESASVNRRPANVTSICQFLFIGSEVSKEITHKLGKINRNSLLEALRVYKTDRTRESFGRVLEACGL